MREGGHIRAMESMPTLYPDLAEDFKVFARLSRTRHIDPMSGIPSPILFSEIEAYCRLYRITKFEEQKRLIRRIQFMDKVFCEQRIKKDGGHKNNSGPKTGNPKR